MKKKSRKKKDIMYQRGGPRGLCSRWDVLLYESFVVAHPGPTWTAEPPTNKDVKNQDKSREEESERK